MTDKNRIDYLVDTLNKYNYEYYILDIENEVTKEQLEKIGAKNVSSKYLVCYETGEVANITEYKTDSGDILYTK